MIASDLPMTHELDSRSGDGLHVRLVWLTPDDRLFVTVTDSRRDQQLWVEVHDRGRAHDVFHHPFAYAASREAPNDLPGGHAPARVAAWS